MTNIDTHGIAKLVRSARRYGDADFAEWILSWLDGFQGAELIHDCGLGPVLVTEPDRWYACDGMGEGEQECGDDGPSAREEYVGDGSEWIDPSDESTTTWVDVASYRYGIDSHGDLERVDHESDTVTIDPDVPECDGSGHRWAAPPRDRGRLPRESRRVGPWRGSHLPRGLHALRLWAVDRHLGESRGDPGADVRDLHARRACRRHLARPHPDPRRLSRRRGLLSGDRSGSVAYLGPGGVRGSPARPAGNVDARR